MITFNFPEGFLLGTGSSSFQIEGGAYEGGKSETMWDWGAKHFPDKFKNHQFAEPASDFYHHYKQDIADMKELGLKSFRLSLSWARILPEKDGDVNPEGIAFYNDVLDRLIDAGIEPFVDLYHWDLPVYMMEIGGFKNREIIPYFEKYAKVCFENFGSKVKLWSTMNEPSVFCYGPYEGRWPPYEKEKDEDFLEVTMDSAHNAILCHYKAVQLFRKMGLKGKIGAVLGTLPIYPKDPASNDKIAAQNQLEFVNGMWLNPMFKGEYPEHLFSETCPEYLKLLTKERAEELKREFAPIDMIGLNYYQAGQAIYDANSPTKSNHLESYNVQEAETGERFVAYPQGLFDMYMYVKEKYNNPEIYITENGLGMADNSDVDKIHDTYRINHLREHLRMVVRCIKAGINIKGYFYWSHFDSFECHNGYSTRFGLNFVDYETGERTKKDSWYYYQKVIKDNCVD